MGDRVIGGLAISGRPIGQWADLTGAPFVTVSPVGIAKGYPMNNGADYGPDTPGTTTGGIQEAVNSLGLGGGTIVLLTGGTFDISSQITVAAHGVFLISASRLKTQDSAGDDLVHSGTDPVMIRATSAMTSMFQWGEDTSGSTYRGGGMAGVCLDGNSNADYCIQDFNVHTLEIMDCYLRGSNTYQLRCYSNVTAGISDIHVERCDFYNLSGSTGGGILFDAGVGQSWIKDCYFLSIYNYGIVLAGNGNNLVSGNYMEGPVTISGSGNAGTYVIVEENADSIIGNQITDAAYHGIMVNDKANHVISGNYVANSNQSSLSDGSNITIWGGGSLDGIVCVGNRCYDNTAKVVHAIYVNAVSGDKGILVSSNLVEGATGELISLGASGWQSGIIISGNGGYNPQGFSVTTPSVPASGTPQKNTNPFPVRVYLLTGGTGTAYAITDPSGTTKTFTTTLVAGMEITLDPGASVTWTYTAAPTQVWYGA
jgi:hypothetical protein